MKKVFSTSDQVIHLFAQRTQHEASCSNVFFEGDKIYSYGYHYLLGEFLDENTIMINDSGYSSTTRKHISTLTYGSRQYKQFFISQTTLKTVYSEVKSLLIKLGRANKPEIYIGNISTLWEKLNEFAEYTRKKAKVTKANFPMYSSEQYKELQKITNKLSKDAVSFKDSLAKIEKNKVEAEKKAVAKSLQKFYAHEIGTFRLGEEDYLRLSLDKKEVETTQGVKVSVESARELYAAILAGVDIRGKQIENYTVTSLNGVLTIGCHKINTKSMHEIGKLISKK